MNYDQYKLASPPTQGFTIACEMCEDLYDTAESHAIEFEQYCSTKCENDANYLDQDDLGDTQQFVDNQDKD
jgi:hypothetical protein